MSDEAQVVTIDVISDVACPWCYLGKRRLARALVAEPRDKISVRWRPYQLDPSIPPGGLDRKAYLRDKFGDEKKLEGAHERLRALGAEEGLTFAFDKIERAPNTLDAHRLIRWASASDVQDEIVERLFSLYFREGGDVGDRRPLVEAAREAGMDSTDVERRLTDGVDENEVRREIAQAQSLGVTGVPFFIFASRFAAPGAQSAEVLAAAIERARKSLAGMAPA
jgi:predicted DsbA family dithiol-disulfide isomerase